jgi:hypothetical protein
MGSHEPTLMAALNPCTPVIREAGDGLVAPTGAVVAFDELGGFGNVG